MDKSKVQGKDGKAHSLVQQPMPKPISTEQTMSKVPSSELLKARKERK